jgi:5-methyltetrahydropteroyltriglutamate--homocysteine methyltransferase
LRDALKKKRKNKITDSDFNAIADRAVLDAVSLQLEAGVDIISDGEMRRENFYSFIADKVEGIKLLSLADLLDHVEDKAAFERLLQSLDVPAFAIHNPVVEGKIKRKAPLALDEFNFVKTLTNKAVKVALPGPYLLTRSMWVKSLSANTYPTKESLGADVVDMLRSELITLRDAGCYFVQFDEPVLSEVAFAGPHATHTFMCAALSEKSSPDSELNFAVELLNAVVDGFTGIKTGLHICRGNWSRRDDVLLAGAYDPLLPYFARMNVNQLVLEFATDRAGSVETLLALPEGKEIGLGVMNPRTSEIESTEFVRAKVSPLLKHRNPSTIFLNPDCGFGTFSDRPVNDSETAKLKLAALSRAAQEIRQSIP